MALQNVVIFDFEKNTAKKTRGPSINLFVDNNLTPGKLLGVCGPIFRTKLSLWVGLGSHLWTAFVARGHPQTTWFSNWDFLTPLPSHVDAFQIADVVF